MVVSLHDEPFVRGLYAGHTLDVYDILTVHPKKFFRIDQTFYLVQCRVFTDEFFVCHGVEKNQLFLVKECNLIHRHGHEGIPVKGEEPLLVTFVFLTPRAKESFQLPGARFLPPGPCASSELVRVGWLIPVNN